MHVFTAKYNYSLKSVLTDTHSVQDGLTFSVAMYMSLVIVKHKGLYCMATILVELNMHGLSLYLRVCCVIKVTYTGC